MGTGKMRASVVTASILFSQATWVWAFTRCHIHSGAGTPPRIAASTTVRLSKFDSSTADIGEEVEESSQHVGKSFRSPKFRVYIEDTDAYGVMYNSNYLRAYERASAYIIRHDFREQQNQKMQQPVGRFILTAITNQKFRTSPQLGEEYEIRGKFVGSTNVDSIDSGRGRPENSGEIWELELVTGCDGDESSEVVCNSATVTFTCSSTPSSTSIFDETKEKTAHSQDPTEAKTIDGQKIHESIYTPFHDEFDSHHPLPFFPLPSEGSHVNPRNHPNFHLPLRSAMNMFERSRSDFLGGPNALRKMQVEDDLLWVVTGVEDGQLFLDWLIFEGVEGYGDNCEESVVNLVDGPIEEYLPETNMLSTSQGNKQTPIIGERIDPDSLLGHHPTPGRELVVQTSFVAKRRGMIIECQHKLFMDINLESENYEGVGREVRRMVAQATVVIMALKGSTRRPTSKLPQWILDQLVQ